MTNYQITHVEQSARVELHDALALTGAEISLNTLPAGAGVPFVHAHKQNEEIYGILEGSGSVTIDGEKLAVQAGDWLRVAPEAKRQVAAAGDSALRYLCVQVKKGSLEGFTAEDAIIG